jgi:branched-subunit amino acid aminotransferase/4-amino-4-deoxychorismate lyase
VAERPIGVSELDGAEEIALISDTRGWRRAEIVDDR